MDWNDLRVFLAIARSGSLGAAAKQLGGAKRPQARQPKFS